MSTRTRLLRVTATARHCLLPVMLALGGCVSARAAVPAADPVAAVRQAFLDAMAAARLAPTQPAPEDSERLRQYALYPYLQAARLRAELQLLAPAASDLVTPSLPVDERVAAFLQQQGTQPVARGLRADWLASLAARRAWPTFLAQFDPQHDTQVASKCQSFTARLAVGKTTGLVEEVSQVWLAPRVLPEACDPVIEWWKGRGGPGPDLIEQRVRLALAAGESGLARALARTLPDPRGAPLLQWAALIEQPAREVQALIDDPARPVLDEALAAGWMRFARSDAKAAAAAYPALLAARKLDARAASSRALAVALALAWSREPGALEFFGRVDAADYDERAWEWRARAALWAGDWRRVTAAIAAMPDALRQQPRWQYWSARADERLGEFARARTTYAALISTDNWYAMLAAARLDRRFAPTAQPIALSDTTIETLSAAPGFIRARELVLCGMEAEAGNEWRTAYDELPPERQTDAVGLAARWGWHYQAIATAARLRLFNDYDLLYPRPYDFEVREASRRSGLSRPFIYAIIRQESLYRADAASSAGAIGLMQLRPDTARLTARRAGLPVPTRAQLQQPSVNVALGASYLALLVGRFGGESVLATAAYNAGPTSALRWLPESPLDLDIWTENIPYNETRAYVQRVAWHNLVFAWLERRETQDVQPWLRSIRPLDPVPSSAP